MDAVRCSSGTGSPGAAVKTHPVRIIFILLLLGLFLALISPYIYGVSFLFLLAGGICGFTAWLLFLRYLKAHGKIKAVHALKLMTISVLSLLACTFLTVEGLIFANANGDSKVDADVLIVLGAGLRGDTPSMSLAYRLDAANEYLQAHPDTVAILTGGQGTLETVTEAEAMQRYLMKRGVERDRLLLETRASNTIENITYSREILAKNGLEDKPIAVVSNTFHLYRAKRICLRQGLNAQMIAAPVPKIGLIPVSCYLREYASVLLLFAKEFIGIEGA